MTYQEIIEVTRLGKVGVLPNFKGYFRWSYAVNDMVFYNGDFQCRATDLNIANRTDFFYIT